MKIMVRVNEDDPWVEQEIVYHDGTVWFQVDGEFIEIQAQEEEYLY